MTPKYSQILWWHQRNIHKIFIPQKSIHFSENLRDIEIQSFDPQKCPSLRMYEIIRVPPGGSSLFAKVHI